MKFGGKVHNSEKGEIERSFKVHREKLQELDQWLPRLKQDIRDILDLSKNTTCIVFQIDDLYHLKRTDQAFVVDYIHRLCKDIPLYFKIATLRHASTLFVEQGGQPIGAQELTIISRSTSITPLGISKGLLNRIGLFLGRLQEKPAWASRI